MERKQKSFPQEVLGIFLQMFKSLKSSLENFLFEEKSKPKTINIRGVTKSNKSTDTHSVTKSDEMFDMKSIVASAEERDLLRKELEYKAAELHYLLDTTAALLGGKRQRHKKENAKTLVEKWDYMLGATDCDSLIEKFSAIKKSTHTDEETVRSWFDFLAYLGLSQFFAQAEEIILSPKNRRFFENGRLYKDGKQFFISKYPWKMNDDLLIRGELYGEDKS